MDFVDLTYDDEDIDVQVEVEEVSQKRVKGGRGQSFPNKASAKTKRITSDEGKNATPKAKGMKANSQASPEAPKRKRQRGESQGQQGQLQRGTVQSDKGRKEAPLMKDAPKMAARQRGREGLVKANGPKKKVATKAEAVKTTQPKQQQKRKTREWEQSSTSVESGRSETPRQRKLWKGKKCVDGKQTDKPTTDLFRSIFPVFDPPSHDKAKKTAAPAAAPAKKDKGSSKGSSNKTRRPKAAPRKRKKTIATSTKTASKKSRRSKKKTAEEVPVEEYEDDPVGVDICVDVVDLFDDDEVPEESFKMPQHSLDSDAEASAAGSSQAFARLEYNVALGWTIARPRDKGTAEATRGSENPRTTHGRDGDTSVQSIGNGDMPLGQNRGTATATSTATASSHQAIPKPGGETTKEPLQSGISPKNDVVADCFHTKTNVPSVPHGGPVTGTGITVGTQQKLHKSGGELSSQPHKRDAVNNRFLPKRTVNSVGQADGLATSTAAANLTGTQQSVPYSGRVTMKQPPHSGFERDTAPNLFHAKGTVKSVRPCTSRSQQSVPRGAKARNQLGISHNIDAVTNHCHPKGTVKSVRPDAGTATASHSRQSISKGAETRSLLGFSQTKAAATTHFHAKGMVTSVGQGGSATGITVGTHHSIHKSGEELRCKPEKTVMSDNRDALNNGLKTPALPTCKKVDQEANIPVSESSPSCAAIFTAENENEPVGKCKTDAATPDKNLNEWKPLAAGKVVGPASHAYKASNAPTPSEVTGNMESVADVESPSIRKVSVSDEVANHPPPPLKATHRVKAEPSSHPQWHQEPKKAKCTESKKVTRPTKVQNVSEKQPSKEQGSAKEVKLSPFRNFIFIDCGEDESDDDCHITSVKPGQKAIHQNQRKRGFAVPSFYGSQHAKKSKPTWHPNQKKEDTSYGSFSSRQAAAETQDRMFREAVDRMRDRIAADPTILQPAPVDESRSFAVPFLDVHKHYPNHWQWKDPYSRLGLPYQSSVTLVKKHYRKLCLVYHPDKLRAGDSPERFHAITLAYRDLAG